MGGLCIKAEQPTTANTNGPTHTAVKETNREPITYKLLIIGDPAVGKTSVLLRYVKDIFSEDTPTTIGTEEYLSKSITVDGVPTTLNIWDTAGQEKFRTITSSFYRGAQGVIIVFDLSRQETFEHVSKWHEQITKYSPDEVPVIFVGNKADLDSNVPNDKIQDLVKEKGISYFECSAATGKNVDQVFTAIAKLLRPDDDGN